MSFNFLTLTKSQILIICTAFILGIILGSSIINLIIGLQLDQLLYEKKKLIAQVNNQQTKLNKLEKSLAQRKKPVIQNIKIEIETKLDKHTQQNLEEEIFNLLNSLIGREISKVDTQLLGTTLENRIIKTENENFKLNLQWIIIHPTARFRFTTQEEKN
ncbi:hypothetical protein [Halanaerobacter jeridensis]|uniref:PurR-regulated permease PerM n=1 Tax=Halanaerobacter jeridensis TaxID=706427 RepID=A0A938XU19_9FIRM|nr:hypothetical protein [Halanaerobacter jeridensis]MBM7555572.1 putative PurR-regulated permease PerM [Halanaerobacter jeridensis]